MDTTVLIPVGIAALFAVVGLWRLWQGYQLRSVPIVAAGAATQDGPVIVEGAASAAEELVAAPLSGTPVLFAEATERTTRHERYSDKDGRTRTRTRTSSRPLGKVASPFWLQSDGGFTAVDGQQIVDLEDVEPAAVSGPQGQPAAQGVAGQLAGAAAMLGGSQVDVAYLERQLTPGAHLWVRGAQLQQVGDQVQLVGELTVFGRDPRRSVRRSFIHGGVFITAAVAIAAFGLLT